MGLIDRLEYRLLRKLCPSNRRMDGSAYAGKSKLRELMGNEITTRILRSGTVLDFGCGTGADSIELQIRVREGNWRRYSRYSGSISPYRSWERRDRGRR